MADDPIDRLRRRVDAPPRFTRTKLIQREELLSAPEHDDTKHGVAPPAPMSAPMPRRINSPPPFSRPPPPSTPTTQLERELVRLRADVAALLADAAEAERRRGVTIPKEPGWVEPPWWRTARGMATVLGALFTGLAALGVGGWFASRPTAPPSPPAPAWCRW